MLAVGYDSLRRQAAHYACPARVRYAFRPRHRCVAVRLAALRRHRCIVAAVIAVLRAAARGSLHRASRSSTTIAATIADTLSQRARRSRSRSTRSPSGWDGWNPKLSITGFAIRDRAQPDAAAGPAAAAGRRCIVAWTSLLALDLRLKELSIERPRARDPPRRAGPPARGGLRDRPGGRRRRHARSPTGCCASAQIVVRDALVTWNDDLRDAPQLVLDHVMFRLEQSLGRHRFGLVGVAAGGARVAARPARRGHGDVVQGLARGEGTLLRAPRLRRRRAVARVDPAADAGRERRGRGARVVRLRRRQATDVIADLELTDVRARVARNLPQLDLTHLGGRVTWKQRRRPARARDARISSFAPTDGQELAPVALHARDDRGQRRHDHRRAARVRPPRGRAAVDARRALAAARAVAARSRDARAARQRVAAASSRGTVRPTRRPSYRGQRRVRRFGIAASEALPGAASVSGNFTFDETRGDLKLDSRDMRSRCRACSPTRSCSTPRRRRVAGRAPTTASRARSTTFASRRRTRRAPRAGAGVARAQGPGDHRPQGAARARRRAATCTAICRSRSNSHVRDWLRSAIKQGHRRPTCAWRSPAISPSSRSPTPKRGQFLRDVQGQRRRRSTTPTAGRRSPTSTPTSSSRHAA